jgi:branched-chain amino acid transport system ATP-binding protein
MILDLRGVDARYGAVQALAGVDLEVHRGEVVCLLGSNGAGKSTLLGAITSSRGACVVGSIRFEGREIAGSSTDEIVRAGIALSPEGRQLFSDLTVEENLRMGAYLRRGDTAIKEDMAAMFARFPRLEQRRRQIAGTLSGGEQQMVAIARSLMSRPKLLLLDEPSLGLAPLLVKEIMSLIKSINADGVTVLLVEQNARQALRIAHRAYVLEKGRIVAEGPVQQFVNDPTIVGAYLGNP